MKNHLCRMLLSASIVVGISEVLITKYATEIDKVEF